MIREILKYIRKSDLVIEVIDSREPDLTRSRFIENFSIREGKKLLIVLNKGDLIPVNILESWKKYIEEKEGINCVYISAVKRLGTRVLRRKIRDLISQGKVIFVGYPKTGKSSIINSLKGRHSASTSPQPMSPGYTKSVQLFRIDSKIYAWDTPGVIPPDGNKFERAIRGANPDYIEDVVKVAIELISRVETYNPGILSKIYKVEYKEPFELLEKIAIRRGWYYKLDKEPNIEEAAKVIIRDYHEGKIVYYYPPPF
ncbi:MAG: GTPase [Sulfolobaceae archaeon]